MNKIKDFIYDKNDLLVALIIVALATLVIVFRVDTIMAYPSSSAGETKPPLTDAQPPDNGQTSMGGSDVGDDGDAQAGDEDPTVGDGENADGTSSGSGTDNDNGGQTGEDQTPSDNRPQGEGLVSIYIEYGATGSDIAKLLINAGLVKTRDDFYNAVREAGVDTKLQAGSFKIPANATPAEIIKIITN